MNESPPGEGNGAHLSEATSRTNPHTNSTTPSTSTYHKTFSLNPKSSPFFPSLISGPANKYSKLTGAMGASLKTSPITDAMAYANPTLFSTAKITTPSAATTPTTITSASSLFDLTITAIMSAPTSSLTISPTTTFSTSTTPPSTYYKTNCLSKAYHFYPSSSEDLGPLVENYNRLTGAMGAPPKNLPTRHTGAMGAPPNTSPIRLTGASGPSSTHCTATDTVTGSTSESTTVITSPTPSYSTTFISKLRSSPYIQLRRKRPTRPCWSSPFPPQDFSLSANEKSRPTPHSSLLWHPRDLNRYPKNCPRPTKQTKLRWVPRSAARRRLERLRLSASVAVTLLSTTDSSTGNIDKIECAICKDKNKYNTYEMNVNLKPYDIFFTPHFLTFNDVLYWEFKAG